MNRYRNYRGGEKTREKVIDAVVRNLTASVGAVQTREVRNDCFVCDGGDLALESSAALADREMKATR